MSSYLGAVATQGSMTTLTGRPGDWCTRTDLKTTFVLSAADPSQAGNWYQMAVGTRTTVVTSSATPAPNADTDDVYALTALAAAATFAAPTGTPVNGQPLTIRIKDNGTARTLAWNAAYRAVGVTLPTTTVLSKTHYLQALYNAQDSKWDVIVVVREA